MSSESSAKSPRRSVRIGKYEVLAHIATGGMGAVYKARDTELGRDVALKILSPEMAGKPASLERFRREARSAAKLRHENIVTLYEVGEQHGTHFLALEFVDGIDLYEYITGKGQLDPEDACGILTQATKALDHAHKQGIVHRDIKPSNFLLTHAEDGRLLVKLTDMGLAREAADEECRVTRSGTTVGTIDYISPEQARDSGSADIRSDIYSLGCTFYHMLTGRPPFPEGSMAERLLKHIEEEPPDVGALNGHVPEGVRAVLRRMMAKQREDRYQTPAALLKDLAGVDARAVAPADRLDVLAGLARDADEPETPKKSSRAATRRPDSSAARRAAVARRRSAPDSKGVSKTGIKTTAAPSITLFGQHVPVAWMIGSGVALVLLVVAITFVALGSAGRPTHRDEPVADNRPPVVGDLPPVTGDHPPATAPAPRPGPEPPPIPDGPPRLYAAAVDAGKLRQEVEEPWAKDEPPPADAPVLHVGRSALLGAAGRYESLAAACAAAPAGKTSIIEVHDNGPLFQGPVAVSGRSLVLRPAKGYRPLLLWDLASPKADAAKPPAFVSLVQGSLTLEGLEVGVRWTDAPEAGCLFRVAGGDFRARDCTFSVAGRNRTGVSVVRLEGSRGGAVPRCRLDRCLARGGSLVLLDLHSAGADVLLNGCLAAGGDLPLLQAAAPNEPPVRLRVVRSTLVARQTLLQVSRATPADTRPAFDWVGWDCLLGRSNRESGGVLLDLAEGAVTEAVHWRAVNCLYSGWMTLLDGAEALAATNLPAWHKRWGLAEGDRALADTWPPGELHDPAEVLPPSYNPEGTPAGFAATGGPGLLGCDLAALPPARDNWLALTYEHFVGPAVDFLGGSPPDLPVGDPGLFHGARLDLTKEDLGAYLDRVQKTQKLAPRVVLRLAGNGERRSAPVRIKGSSLVLYFEPPEAKAEPLRLLPQEIPLAAGQEGFIEVDDGDLDVIGGSIRYPDFKTALVPPYLVRVRGGSLRLHGCSLQGPTVQPPDVFKGLVRFDGSGKSDPDKAATCALSESVLVSGRAGVQVSGVGARVGLRECVLVCGQDGLHLEPGGAATEPRLNITCALEHVTVAAKGAVLLLGDAPGVARPLTPVIVQTKDCAFLDPLTDPKGAPPHRAGLLLAAGTALERGLLVWQGETDAYDKRLWFQAAAADGPVPEQAQPHAVWARLWGPAGDAQPVLDLTPRGTFGLDRVQLDKLALPAPARLSQKPPGADLVLVGILKKKSP
jgi:serine/threonine-protein kinase